MWTTNIDVIAKERIKLVSAGYTFCRFCFFMKLNSTRGSIVEHLAMKYSRPTETGERNTHRTNYREIPCCWSNRISYHTRPEALEQWHVAVRLKMTDTSHILYMFGLVWISYEICFTVCRYYQDWKKGNQRNQRRDAFLSTKMSLAPCILASLEGDVNHCSVGWWAGCVQLYRNRGFTFVIWVVVVIWFNMISLQKRKLTLPLSVSQQGRARGLCPPAFSDPWLISGAPWQDKCKPS